MVLKSGFPFFASFEVRPGSRYLYEPLRPFLVTHGPQILLPPPTLSAPPSRAQKGMTKDGMPWWMWAIVIFVGLAVLAGLVSSF